MTDLIELEKCEVDVYQWIKESAENRQSDSGSPMHTSTVTESVGDDNAS